MIGAAMRNAANTMISMLHFKLKSEAGACVNHSHT